MLTLDIVNPEGVAFSVRKSKMQRLQTVEAQVFVGPRNVAEAMLLNRVAQTYLGDMALRAKTAHLMQTSINRETPHSESEFSEGEAKLLMTGLRHVITFEKENDYIVAAAQMFLDEQKFPEAREMNDMRVQDYERQLERTGEPPFAEKLIGYQALMAHKSFEEIAGRIMAATEDYPTSQLALTQEL